MVGYTEVILKRRSRKLAIRSHIGAAAVGCPKTCPLRCLQIADSTGVRFAGIGAHKQMFSEPLFGTFRKYQRKPFHNPARFPEVGAYLQGDLIFA